MASDEDSHACVKLMMTQETVRFEVKDNQVVKMIFVGLSDTPTNGAEPV